MESVRNRTFLPGRRFSRLPSGTGSTPARGKVYLFENSSQAALTRLVFEQAGYAKVGKRTGAKPIYLDEDKTVPYPFAGKGPVSERDPKGYDLTTFGMPRTVAEKLIGKRTEPLCEHPEAQDPFNGSGHAGD